MAPDADIFLECCGDQAGAGDSVLEICVEGASGPEMMPLGALRSRGDEAEMEAGRALCLWPEHRIVDDHVSE